MPRDKNVGISFFRQQHSFIKFLGNDKFVTGNIVKTVFVEIVSCEMVKENYASMAFFIP